MKSDVMADWFKVFENDLDDARLQWAMSEQQQVFAVSIGIDSGCCRDKSGTIPWNDEELELFALANRLRITVPIVNQCIKLLERIGFIKIDNGKLINLRWKTRQSDYCQKRVRTVSGQSPDKVRRKSNPSPLLSISSSDGGVGEAKEPATAKSEIRSLPKGIDTERMRAKWQAWIEYRKALKGCKDWAALFNEQLEWLGKFEEPDAFEVLSQSIRNSWKGLFEIRAAGFSGTVRKKPHIQNI